MSRLAKPTARFLARVTHDGGTQVCWAEKLPTSSRRTAAGIYAFVTLTPQEKQRGGWVFFSEWEVVTLYTVKEKS